MASRLKWRGDEVAAKLRRDATAAVDETTEAAAEEATQDHWWRSRSGTLEKEVVTRKAKPTAKGVKGSFGATKTRGFYGLILESQQPWLRPAADKQFPQIIARMRMR